MSLWEDYALTLPELSQNWHVYAVDVYGQGESTHKESLYYLDVIGDDLIWFIDHVIAQPVVVSGHSNGGIIAAYIGRIYTEDKHRPRYNIETYLK